MASKYEIVIGLEIHAQLMTESKCFAPVRTFFGGAPNSQVHWICAGYPGTLPVLNEKVVDLAVKATLAFGGQVQRISRFERKQYFYPDMPKGYQISQFKEPVCLGGTVEFFFGEEIRRVPLERAHIEEDAGKSTHFGQYSLIDLNRAGTPLLEIVSRPELRSPAEAAAFARAVRQLLKFNGICDGNLEEGSLRCDCNISLRRRGETQLGTKVEIKNINSFRFIEKALEYEAERQAQVLETGGRVEQETRLYDPGKNRTFLMRKKEEATDYRYFPDPDLPALIVDDLRIERILKELVESPTQRQRRFQSEYLLSFAEAELLVSELELADYFERLVLLTGQPKLTCNWLVGEFMRLLNESKLKLADRPIKDENFADLLKLLARKEISGPIAKEVFTEMWTSGEGAQAILNKKGLRQVQDDGQILVWVEQVISENPKVVQDYRSGKEKLFGFFVGQVMKLSKGQANPEKVNSLLKEKLQ